MSRKQKRCCRSKEAIQEALDLYNRAIEGDADAMIKVWKIITEDDDEIGGDNDGYYK